MIVYLTVLYRKSSKRHLANMRGAETISQMYTKRPLGHVLIATALFDASALSAVRGKTLK